MVFKLRVMTLAALSAFVISFCDAAAAPRTPNRPTNNAVPPCVKSIRDEKAARYSDVYAAARTCREQFQSDGLVSDWLFDLFLNKLQEYNYDFNLECTPDEFGLYPQSDAMETD